MANKSGGFFRGMFRKFLLAIFALGIFFLAPWAMDIAMQIKLWLMGKYVNHMSYLVFTTGGLFGYVIHNIPGAALDKVLPGKQEESQSSPS